MFEIGEFVLQLHELNFAIASPIGTAMKEDKGLVCAVWRISDLFTPLIGEGKCGNRFTYVGA